MSNYRKVSFWIQVLAITADTLAGAIINDRMGSHWSFWRRLEVRLACLAVAVGVVTVVGIVSHLPTRRRDRISTEALPKVHPVAPRSCRKPRFKGVRFWVTVEDSNRKTDETEKADAEV